MWIRRIFDSVLIQVVLAMVLGILCGLFFGEKTGVVKWAGEAYVRLLQMTDFVLSKTHLNFMNTHSFLIHSSK
jgi:ABC-type amino acid transport system permease subunit